MYFDASEIDNQEYTRTKTEGFISEGTIDTRNVVDFAHLKKKFVYTNKSYYSIDNLKQIIKYPKMFVEQAKAGKILGKDIILARRTTVALLELDKANCFSPNKGLIRLDAKNELTTISLENQHYETEDKWRIGVTKENTATQKKTEFRIDYRLFMELLTKDDKKKVNINELPIYTEK